MYSIRDEAEKAARHFIIAAIWADAEEGTNPRPSAQAKRAAFNICHTFMCRNLSLTARTLDKRAEGYGSHPDCGVDGAAAAFGHDLYLTLAGHGAGFWDRKELGELGDELTAACEQFGSVERWQSRGWFYVTESGVR